MAEGDWLALICNDVVHGYLAEYDERNNHLLTFVKAKVDNKRPQKIHEIVLRTITVEDLIAAVHEVENLAEEIATLNLSLLGIPDPTENAAQTERGRG